MKSQIINGIEALQHLRGPWSELERRALLPMQEFAWIEAAALTFASHGKIRFLIVTEGEAIKAVAPLVLRRGNPYLEMLGVSTLYEPMNVVWTDDDALFCLTRALADLKLPLFLERIPLDSPLVESLMNAFRRRGVMFSRPNGSWPLIPIDDSWIEPENKFNAKRRAYLKRARRIADEMGPVRSELIAPISSDMEMLLHEFLRIEASGWKGANGTALMQDALRGPFFRRYARAACEKGTLRFGRLTIGERVVASQFAVETCGGLWLFKIGYDERFSQCSPGNLLIRDTLSQAARRGLKFVALLGADEPWKKQWASESHSCVVLRGYPWGFRGGVRFTQDALQSFWNQLHS